MSLQDAFFFDAARLDRIAEKRREAYAAAEPFPHAVIDDFLPVDVAERILEYFPEETSREWLEFKNAREKKLANNHDALMPPLIRHILAQFNAAAVCGFLEKLTGIEGIIPDPYFWGGGQHQIKPGGYLKVHADFNRHRKLPLDRRLNLLLYLNKDWEESYGGYLELWDREMKACVQRILPIFNRCVIFTTTSDSYHGHPEPLTCPEDRTRKSLALYYYTAGRPETEQNEPHTTIFKQRPGEGFRESNEGLTVKTVAKKLLPPIILDGIRAVRGRK
ncbi:MAG: 2OG-Fe(II) oxygenase [Acidobacteriota bacterium]|nr:2OG-Fe(II) oxygenase [Acidobacteriota bacterium]